MNTYTYSVRIEPAEEGGYNVFVPALPGCVTQADSYQQAVAMARESIEGFVEALTKAGQPVPVEPQPPTATLAAIRVELPEAA